MEDVVGSARTPPVVRERLLEVLAGAAFMHPSQGRDGFSGAWRRVKPPSAPDEVRVFYRRHRIHLRFSGRSFRR